MKYYSNYTTKYIQDICDAINETELRKTLSPIDENANRPFASENFETLTSFIKNYVVMPSQIYHFLDSKQLVNRGVCPYTGVVIDSTHHWKFAGTRFIYLSVEGLNMMIKESDEEFEKITGHPAPKTKTKSEGCYIASVCYGDEFAREVLILKSYRDDVLSKSFFGNIFIKIYYFISPKVANYLQNKFIINKFIREIVLDKIVHKVNKRKIGKLH